MTEQKKLPSKIEENIQNLAGDIYLQIEDKITALLTAYGDDFEISPELIEQQPCFQQLSQDNLQLRKRAEQNEKSQNFEIKTLITRNEKLQSQLDLQTQELENHAKLNRAKLTDTEQALKENLQENSQLNKRVIKLISDNDEYQQTRLKSQQEVEALSLALSETKAKHDILSKNDKAKTVTISVQNQQISDLQLKHEQVASELEYLKAEQEQALQSSNELLSTEQKQAVVLIKQQQVLEREITENNQQISQLKNDNAELIHQARLTQESQTEQVKEAEDLANKYQQLHQENKDQSQQLHKENLALNHTISKSDQQLIEDKKQLLVLQKNLEILQKDIVEYNDKEQKSDQQLTNLAQKISQQTMEQQKLVTNNQQLKNSHQQDIEKLQVNHQRVLNELKRNVDEKNAALNDLQKHVDSSEKSFAVKISQQTQEILDHTEQLEQEQKDSQTLSEKNHELTRALNDLEQQINQLEQSLQTEKSIVLKNQQTVQENKVKQELEYNKARETIKYLRDENTELNRKLIQQVNELEDKLTEYRLRFEYAQKQLTKIAK
jgi:hypothetical protein